MQLPSNAITHARVRPHAPPQAWYHTDEQTDCSTSDGQHYVVDNMKSYRASEGKYLVHWYGYNDAADDTLEPPEHIPANLRTRFYKSQENKASRRQLSRQGHEE